jgi:hypothetical protein
MCEVMRDEWLSVNPGIETVFLEQGLHQNPARLHKAVQGAIDALSGCDSILLGYGLCANALLGIAAKKQRLIIPLVEDCISLFLGSARAYRAQFAAEPGTYYFTKGWIVGGKDPYQEYLRSCAKWGEADADWIARETMKNYRRAAYIDTGCYDTAEYRNYVGRFAGFFGLRPEIIAGSRQYFRELAAGNWRRCLVVAPGEAIAESEFRRSMDLLAAEE